MCKRKKKPFEKPVSEENVKKWIIKAYVITIFLTIAVFVVGTVLENKKLICGYMLSDFMETCFAAHAQQEWNVGYFLYYLFLYLVTTAYLIPSLYLLAKKNEVGWLSYVIFLNIVFLFFINAYLTEMLQYHDDSCEAIYSTYMTSFTCVATAIIGIAGIKMGLINQSHKKSKPLEEAHLE